jgi:hypothetical protein
LFSQETATNNADTAALSLNGEVNDISIPDDDAFSGDDDLSGNNTLSDDDDFEAQPELSFCQLGWTKCRDDEVCCRSGCKSCCNDRDCVEKIIDYPPPGEFGEAMCVNSQCQSYKNGESSQIPADGVYPVWLASETSDEPNKFRELKIPRRVYEDGGPLMEQVWRIDFEDQETSFEQNKVVYNETHITIPSYESLHVAYSRSYNHLNEHETGVLAMIMIDNAYSVVADRPKLAFVEKYHTLTFNGTKETRRADHIKEIAEQQLKEQPEFDEVKWFSRAFSQATQALLLSLIPRQLEAGLDKALAWQIRRYADSYPESKLGTVNPSTSDSWKRHSMNAKQAIKHARDPNFEREYLKSETHCKHFEELDGLEGVSFTEDSVTFPMGRPITGYTGEMVMSPVYYLGFGVGHITLHYDPETSVLEMFFQTFSHSRQHSDVEFPGPDPEKGNALYVSPVAEGDEYKVDPKRDGRTDKRFSANVPGRSEYIPISGKPDFTLWARPTEEVCNKNYIGDGKWSNFWETINGAVMDYGDAFDMIGQPIALIKGVVGGMPCAGTYMRTDYGGNGFEVEEIGVFFHSLVEIPSGQTENMLLGTFWDGWECFYRGCEMD